MDLLRNNSKINAVFRWTRTKRDLVSAGVMTEWTLTQHSTATCHWRREAEHTSRHHVGWRGSICGEDLPVLSFPLGREVWVQARVGTAWIWGLPEARWRRSSHRGRSHVDSDPDATQQAAQGRLRDGVRGKSWKHAPRWHPGLFHMMLFKHLFLPSGHAGCSLIWSPRARLRALKQIPFRSSFSSDFKYQKSKTRQTRAIV